jgi:flagellar protein FlgJ
MANSLQPVIPMPVASTTASSSSANTYTDLNALAGLKKDSHSPQALHAIAQQVDALFLQMMLKSMRDATAGDGEADSNEMGMYQDMFDKQISLTLSQHQDLGLGSMVTRHMSAAASAAPATTAAPAAAAPTGTTSTATTPRTTSPGTTPAGTATPASAATPSGTATLSGTATSSGTATDSAAVPSTSMLQSAGQFVDQVLPAITRAARALGVSPLGMLAQAALETGWGTRMARTADGSPSLNMFGIKAGDSWDGARASASTLEFSGGVATQRHTAFRAYGSIEESVADFANLLKTSPRYRAAVSAGGNAQAYINSIGQAGYATDPEYTNKLNEILNGGTLALALNFGSTRL